MLRCISKPNFGLPGNLVKMSFKCSRIRESRHIDRSIGAILCKLFQFHNSLWRNWAVRSDNFYQKQPFFIIIADNNVRKLGMLCYGKMKPLQCIRICK